MPYFRIDLVTGPSQESRAVRVLRDSRSTWLEDRQGGQWVTVLEVPNETVAAVRQRLNEVNGDWRWVVTEPGRVLGVHHARHDATGRS